MRTQTNHYVWSGSFVVNSKTTLITWRLDNSKNTERILNTYTIPICNMFNSWRMARIQLWRLVYTSVYTNFWFLGTKMLCCFPAAHTKKNEKKLQTIRSHREREEKEKRKETFLHFQFNFFFETAIEAIECSSVQPAVVACCCKYY